MRRVKLEELILDYLVYPRTDVDSQHVSYMCAALEAGASLPPLVVDKASLRIVDGFHRYRAYQRRGVKAVEIVEKSYGSDKDILLDSIRYNAGHGRSLTTFDRTHCLIRADEMKIEPEQVAAAMHLTMEAVGKLRAERIGTLRGSRGSTGASVPLKRTVRHMAGQKLTKAQIETNDKLGGMQQSFYVNQVIMLIESGMLDREDESLMERLKCLSELLEREITALA